MVCPDCHSGYMLQHNMPELQARKWVKCSICGFCCKEVDLVQFYKKDPSERNFTGKLSPQETTLSTETETQRRDRGTESGDQDDGS